MPSVTPFQPYLLVARLKVDFLSTRALRWHNIPPMSHDALPEHSDRAWRINTMWYELAITILMSDNVLFSCTWK